MKKIIGFIIMIASFSLFYFTYDTANKKIWETSILGKDGMSSIKITPFNYEENKEVMSNVFELYKYLNKLGNYDQSKLEDKVIKYKKLTYFYGLGGILLFIISLGVLLRGTKKLT
jgi:uncharacterized BrkB/YihY/UPF0761 family membrane protein